MSSYKLFVRAALLEHDEGSLGPLQVEPVAARIAMPLEEAREHLARMLREGLAYKNSNCRDDFLLELTENRIEVARLRGFR